MATNRFEADDSTNNNRFNKFFGHMKLVMDHARTQYREKKAELRREADRAQKNVQAGKGGLKERVKAATLKGASNTINALSPDNHLYLGREMKGEMSGLVLHRDKKSGGYYMEAVRPVVIQGIGDNKDIKLKPGEQTGLYMLDGKQAKQDFANAINNGQMNIFVEHGAKLEVKDNLIDPIKTLGSRARVMDQGVLSVGKEANVNRTTIKGKSIVAAIREMSGNDIEDSNVNVDGKLTDSKITHSNVNGIGGIYSSTIDLSDIHIDGKDSRNPMISTSTIKDSVVNNTAQKHHHANIYRGNLNKSYLVDTTVRNSDIAHGYVTGSAVEKSTLMLKENNNHIDHTMLSNTVIDDKGKVAMKNCHFDHTYVNGTDKDAKQFDNVISKLSAYTGTDRFADSRLEGSYRKNKAGKTAGVRIPIFKNTTGSNAKVKATRVSQIYTGVDFGDGAEMTDKSYVPSHRDKSMNLKEVDNAFRYEQKKFENNFLFGTDMPTREYDIQSGRLINTNITEQLDDRNEKIGKLFTEIDDMIAKGNQKAQRYNAADRGDGNVVSLADWKDNVLNKAGRVFKIKTDPVKTPASELQEVSKAAEAVMPNLNKPKLEKEVKKEKTPRSKVVDIKNYQHESSDDGPDLM